MTPSEEEVWEAAQAGPLKSPLEQEIFWRMHARAAAIQLGRERDALKEAVMLSTFVLDFCLYVFSPEISDQHSITAMRTKIEEGGGIIAFIAGVQEKNRAALKWEPKCEHIGGANADTMRCDECFTYLGP